MKTHDLKQLLDEAVVYDKRFERYYDLMDILTEFYFEEKYPFGKIGITLKQTKEKLKEAKEIIGLIGDLL